MTKNLGGFINVLTVIWLYQIGVYASETDPYDIFVGRLPSHFEPARQTHFRPSNPGTETRSCWENRDQFEVGEQGWCRKDSGSSQPTGTVCANKDRDIPAVEAVSIVNEGESNMLLFDIEITPIGIIYAGSEFLQPSSKWALLRSVGAMCIYIYIMFALVPL